MKKIIEVLQLEATANEDQIVEEIKNLISDKSDAEGAVAAANAENETLRAKVLNLQAKAKKDNITALKKAAANVVFKTDQVGHFITSDGNVFHKSKWSYLKEHAKKNDLTVYRITIKDTNKKTVDLEQV